MVAGGDPDPYIAEFAAANALNGIVIAENALHSNRYGSGMFKSIFKIENEIRDEIHPLYAVCLSHIHLTCDSTHSHL